MEFELASLTSQDRYKLLSASITPRPIAWITSLSVGGAHNAAPYSFFNMIGPEPPQVVLGLMHRPNGTHKDSATNILETGEFVVNLVSHDDAASMNFTCIDAPPEFDEIAAAQIATAPSIAVAPVRIASAPVSIECRLYQAIEASASTVVLGEAVHIHIADRFIDPKHLHVDAPAMDLIARMHGAGWYARAPELFQMTRPTYDDWTANRPAPCET